MEGEADLKRTFIVTESEFLTGGDSLHRLVRSHENVTISPFPWWPRVDFRNTNYEGDARSEVARSAGT